MLFLSSKSNTSVLNSIVSVAYNGVDKPYIEKIMANPKLLKRKYIGCDEDINNIPKNQIRRNTN